MRNLSLLSLSAPLLLAGSAAAFNNSCGGTFFEYYNASGSVAIPGFRVNDSYPASTWTWSKYVSNIDVGTNRTSAWSTLGLKTDPVQNLSDAANVPYTACVFAMTELASAISKKGSTDDGTCSSVFSSSCVSEIISAVNASAASLSSTASGSASGFSCPSLLRGVSQDCQKLWTGSVSTQFLVRNFTGNSNPRCPANETVNPGDSDSVHSAFFGWSSYNDDVGATNFTSYDAAIEYPTPLIVAAWLKATTNSSTSGPVMSGANGWADTRLLCVTANQSVAGSRNVTQARQESGAVGREGVGLGVLALAASALAFASYL
ncbi:hypothetical protein BP6252_02277 [Coleophoma cylindrospora]|uniref:Uncharacterized protein n=1 Tax=Coleophoma cylindrospora TaxID=1849047 RepID=A0A3D8SEA9_9HELO|nr:hypothetical protein BP6252_02277 [Coleophoma cylindrospora]